MLPALDGASIAGIVPALFGRVDNSWIPGPALEAEAVVLLVLDGLGWSALQDRAAATMPRLAAMTGSAITTVAPSTTATALTSIATGLAPAQHGIVGYRMLVGDDVLNVLRWSGPSRSRLPSRTTCSGTRPSSAARCRWSRGRSSARPGSHRAHLRGTRFAGWHTTVGLVEQCVRAVEAGERFVYAYYPGIDAVAHEFGLRDGVFARELAFADRLVGDSSTRCPRAQPCSSTSDHGQVHLDAESWIDVPELGAMSAAMAGDGRFRYSTHRPAAAASCWPGARARVGPGVGVVASGAPRDGRVRRRRGRHRRGSHRQRGARGARAGRVRGSRAAERADAAIGHGSLTPDEMYVPLVAAPGARP